MSSIYFYYPWKHQKNYGFAMISESIERDEYHDLGSRRELTEWWVSVHF